MKGKEQGRPVFDPPTEMYFLYTFISSNSKSILGNFYNLRKEIRLNRLTY